jgi:hypothetical protein
MCGWCVLRCLRQQWIDYRARQEYGVCEDRSGRPEKWRTSEGLVESLSLIILKDSSYSATNGSEVAQYGEPLREGRIQVAQFQASGSGSEPELDEPERIASTRFDVYG